MKQILTGFVAVLGLMLLSGCGTFNDRRIDPAFNFVAPQATDTVIFIGGNSEYRGGGVWDRKYDMVENLAYTLGYGARIDTISRVYYSWTGDDPGTGTLLPSNLDYLDGQVRIADELQRKGYLLGSSLIVIAWSNGGKTAVQLSNVLATRAHKVSLLVTFDPVSTLTGRSESADVDSWLDVYPRSGFWARFLKSNIIAWIGGAWNDLEGKGYVSLKMNDCIVGDHNDVTPMWDRAVQSQAFRTWAESASGHPMNLPSRQYADRMDCPKR